ncbi:hypothetical protein [Candidatus Avelusimicrobium faecicola]|uniref:hypothetical protein n=1 Tax=Candidatus Avelusimicrobium faecicola TaxID=3416205 RepID=UPI003D0D7518
MQKPSGNFSTPRAVKSHTQARADGGPSGTRPHKPTAVPRAATTPHTVLYRAKCSSSAPSARPCVRTSSALSAGRKFWATV